MYSSGSGERSVMKSSIYAVIFIVGGRSLIFVRHPAFTGVIYGMLAGMILVFINALSGNFAYIGLWISSKRFRNVTVRLSVSYLYRIKVDDKYLLVRGDRFSQFQPVGGVFKTLSDSVEFFNKMEASDDDLVPIDKTSKDDLRIRIKGRHLLKFMRWYELGTGRETSRWREFYEELIAPGYLHHEDFPYISYRHQTPIRYSDPAQSLKMLIAEIYELIPTPRQKEKLTEISKIENVNYVWLDESRIKRMGVIPKENLTVNVSQHASWIL